MLGCKIYYEVLTGDVILTIPEKHNQGAVATTKEQDFAMFDVLQMRSPESLDSIQLGYGEYRGDFEIANSWKVDLETKEILFSYPLFDTPLTEQVKKLTLENKKFKEENEELKKSQAEQDEIIMTLMLGGM